MDKRENKHDINVNKWEITENRYVAYIDIMGFKDMVARARHEDIYDMMKKIDNSKKTNSSIKWGKADSDLITTTTYSDSIMIYSKDESYESLYSLICTISALAYDLFVECIPYKGAFAYGLMTLDTDKSIFFGQPLIDAYLLQEELNFYGIVAHSSVEEKIDMFLGLNKLFVFIKNYPCNFKNGNSKHLAIHPIYVTPSLVNDPKYKDKVDLLFDSLKRMRYKTSGQLRKYIDNTEGFLNNIKDGNIN